MTLPIPDPSSFRDWQAWARAITNVLRNPSGDTVVNNPIVLWQMEEGTPTRAIKGLLGYNVEYGSPLLYDGAWQNITPNCVELEYSESNGVDGNTLSSGANVVPLTTEVRNTTAWCTHDNVQGTVNLLTGLYYFDGFCTIAAHTASNLGAKLYLGDYSTPGTELTGNFASGSVAIPSGPTKHNLVVPFQGFYQVSNETLDIALVCETSAAGLQLGYDHSLTKDNSYARLRVSLIEASP